jgi:predicted dehydrogenase
MKVGILGAGGIGNVHARHLRAMPGVEVIFYEIDSGRSELFAKAHDVRPVKSAKALLEEADAIDLCLPTDVRSELAIEAIATGKAVFLEKPVAGSVESGRVIAEAAAKSGAKVGVGHVVRFFPEYREANRLVREGKIGKPASARARRGGGLPGKAGATWFQDHNRSGGVLIDLGVHEFDFLRWTLGEVETVFARSVGAATMSGPDYALTTLKFKNGAVAQTESTWMDPGGFRVSFEFCGSEGMLEYDSRNVTTLKTSSAGGSMVEAPLASSDDPFYCQLKAFVDSVANGTEPPVGIEDGIRSLAIAEAALKSARTGKPVTVD